MRCWLRTSLEDRPGAPGVLAARLGPRFRTGELSHIASLARVSAAPRQRSSAA